MLALTNILPGVPWYIVVHYILCFGSIYLISLITLKKNDRKSVYVVITIMQLFLGYECYAAPNYIKTSSILIASAIYYFIYYFERDAKKVVPYVIFAFMSLASSLFSYYAFSIVLIVSFVLVLIYCLINKLSKKNYIVLLVAFLLVFGIGTLLHCYDCTKYEDELRTHRPSMEKLLSFGYPEYDENEALKLGIHEEKEFNNLKKVSYFNGNEDEYSLVDGIANMKNSVSINQFFKFMKTILINLFSDGAFFLYIFLLFVLFMCSKHLKIVTIVTVIVMIVPLFVLYLLNSASYVWIYTMILMPICCFTLANINDMKLDNSRVLLAFSLLLTLMIYKNFENRIVSNYNYDSMTKQFDEKYENVISLIDMSNYVRFFSPFKPYPQSLANYDNVYYVNGIYTFFDDYDSVTQIGTWTPEQAKFYSDEEIDRLISEGKIIDDPYDDRKIIKSGNYVWIQNINGYSAEKMLQTNLEDFYNDEE